MVLVHLTFYVFVFFIRGVLFLLDFPLSLRDMSWSLTFPRSYLSQCRLSRVFVSRWPRTLAGITAYLQCTRNAHGSGIYPGNAQDERKAWRRCDRGGFWADDDYSRCQYANDVTRVLYMFNQVTGKSSGLLRLLIRRGAHTKYILLFFFFTTSKA